MSRSPRRENAKPESQHAGRRVPPSRSSMVGVSALGLAGLAACGSSTTPVAAPRPPAAPVAPPVASAAPPALSVALPPWASSYPASRSQDVKDTLFGTEVHDPYRWLEDAKAPEVQAWVKAQDDLARAKLSALPDRAALASRLKEVAYVDAQSPPSVRGGRIFYYRRSATQDKWVFHWRAGKTAPEKVLLDPNTWSTDGSTSLHDTSVSWDGKLVAYTVSQNNSDDATLRVVDVATGKESPVDAIVGARYAHASWTPKGDGFYYTWIPVDPKIPEDARPGYQEVRFHRLGTDPAKDVTIREKTGDPSTFVGGSVTKDGRWVVVEIQHGWTSNELFFRPASATAKDWTRLPVNKESRYDLSEYKGRFYVRTNEGAPRNRVFAIDPAHPEREAWKEIVPERKDAALDGIQIIGGKLALSYIKDVTSRIELRSLDGAPFREVTLPGLGTGWITGEDDQDEAFWGYQTYVSPSEIHATSIARGGDSLWFRVKVPVDSSAFVVEQTFFTSRDGTRVPMFVVHAKSFVKDGTAPAYVTGYGGFNSAEQPYFSSSTFPWLERGGIFVDVTLRGGSEYGEEWHRAGMKHEKQHVFDDFEAALDALAKEKFTNADKIVIEGGSNGGLLVGATVTQRPDLFRAAICAVPLLDMIRYTDFGAGKTWISEYGSTEDEGDFRALFGYSPYHHVTPGTRYPAVLLDSADSDDRVDPMHARKMAAELQAASSGGPVLLRIEKHSGHGGADLIRAAVERNADRYAFALAELRRVGGSVTP